MNSSRRSLIKIFLGIFGILFAGFNNLLKPVFAFAQRNNKAFSAETVTDAIDSLFPENQLIPSDAIQIDVHDVIENGAVVPVRINTDLPDTESISILVEKNPNPFIAKFNLGPDCSGFIATRIKVAEPADVIVIVESRGKLYSQRKFVEVVAGGCG
jgi:sulfur-oxidizing protein SoxY